MVDVAIDLNLHHEGPSDGLLTRYYVYNQKIDQVAAGGTVLIANLTEKVPYAQDIFFKSNNTKIRTERLFRRIHTYNGHNIQSRN